MERSHGTGMRRGLAAFVCLLACLVLHPWTLAHRSLDVQILDLTRLIAEDPEDAGLYLRRGELHRIHRDWKAARADYERSRELDPELAVVDFCLGKMHLEAGQPAEALPALNRFLALRPGDPRALALRARIRSALGEPLEAAEDYSRALSSYREAGKPPPEVYVEHARALAAMGEERLEEALRGLEDGLELLGGPVALELEALELELALGRTEAALARVDRLAAIAAVPASWMARRGEILERAGRFHGAIAAYGRALEILETLPAHRRRAEAISRLEGRIRADRDRLAGGGGRKDGADDG